MREGRKGGREGGSNGARDRGVDGGAAAEEGPHQAGPEGTQLPL